MSEIVLKASELLVMVATLLIVRHLIPFVKKWVTAKQLEELKGWASDGVRWAQDWMSAEPGDDKRSAVINILKDIRDKEGIDLDDGQLTVLVRAAYVAMKEAQGDVYVIETEAEDGDGDTD